MKKKLKSFVNIFSTCGAYSNKITKIFLHQIQISICTVLIGILAYFQNKKNIKQFQLALKNFFFG